jgi:hypothetical protein
LPDAKLYITQTLQMIALLMPKTRSLPWVAAYTRDGFKSEWQDLMALWVKVSASR